MFADSVLDELIMHLQQPQHAGFIAAHLTAEADNVGEHDGCQVTSLGVGNLAGGVLHGGDYSACGSWLSTVARANVGAQAVALTERAVAGSVRHAHERRVAAAAACAQRTLLPCLH